MSHSRLLLATRRDDDDDYGNVCRRCWELSLQLYSFSLKRITASVSEKLIASTSENLTISVSSFPFHYFAKSELLAFRKIYLLILCNNLIARI